MAVEKASHIKAVSQIALFAAVISVSALICLPLPSGVGFTLQTLAVSLCGYCLGAYKGAAAAAVYLALGAVGLPIFSAFSGGLGVLFRESGGFLWGFLVLAVLTGATRKLRRALKWIFGCVAVLLCHAIGIWQFALVSGTGFLSAFLTASLPFILKDFICIILAERISCRIIPTLKG